MEKTRHILAINVGSTSTKVAFYRDSERIVQESLAYSAADLAGFKDLRDQLSLRESGLRSFIEKNNIDMRKVDLVVSRGGLDSVTRPVITSRLMRLACSSSSSVVSCKALP